jgi:GT2 family glycosyltransferase
MISDQLNGEVRLASVVVPTIGRTVLLRACLESLGRCKPRAREIVVVDGSGGDHVAALTAAFAEIGVRRVLDGGKGTAGAVNIGLAAAAHDTVLLTHDDCTVAPNWVDSAVTSMCERPDGIVTGRVLPHGDPRCVPGLATNPKPYDYTGTRARVLLAHNMVCSRRAVLGVGGFDERVLPVSEDDDLGYRWLRSGRSLRYTPDLTVWHHAWRSPQEMPKLYRAYARGDGMFYAKHLRSGDLAMLGYIAADVRAGLRAEIAALRLRKRHWWDHRLGIFAGLPVGLWRGFRTFGPRAKVLVPVETLKET